MDEHADGGGEAPVEATPSIWERYKTPIAVIGVGAAVWALIKVFGRKANRRRGRRRNGGRIGPFNSHMEAGQWLWDNGFVPEAGTSRWRRNGEIGRIEDRQLRTGWAWYVVVTSVGGLQRNTSKPTVKAYLEKVRLNRGGYTSSGRYFGIGAPLYQFDFEDWGPAELAGYRQPFDAGGYYLRASSRAEAKAKLRDRFRLLDVRFAG